MTSQISILLIPRCTICVVFLCLKRLASENITHDGVTVETNLRTFPPVDVQGFGRPASDTPDL